MTHHSVKTTNHLPVEHANTTWGARWTGGTVDLRWGGFCSVSFCRKRPPLMQHCATFSYLPPSCCAMWEAGEREEEEEKRIRRKRRRRYSLPFNFSSFFRGLVGGGVGSSHDFSINNNVGDGERERKKKRKEKRDTEREVWYKVRQLTITFCRYMTYSKNDQEPVGTSALSRISCSTISLRHEDKDKIRP